MSNSSRLNYRIALHDRLVLAHPTLFVLTLATLRFRGDALAALIDLGGAADVTAHIFRTLCDRLLTLRANWRGNGISSWLRIGGIRVRTACLCCTVAVEIGADRFCIALIKSKCRKQNKHG
jgi:hypothetical protein